MVCHLHIALQGYAVICMRLLIFLLLLPLAYGEFTGTINISTLGTPLVTGLFGYTVKYCDIDSQCMGYKCFIDFDGEVDDSDTSQPAGICNSTATATCFTDSVWRSGICTNSTAKRACTSGVWGNVTNCPSGETCSADGACAKPSADSAGGGAGGGGNISLKHSIKLVSGIADFDIIQGESAAKFASFKNDGNLTLTNITLVLSGITESWYGVNPSRFSSVNVAKEDRFNVSFFIPKDGEVKSYQINAEIKTHKSNISAKFSFTMKVLPSNETVEKEVVPKYGRLLSALEAIEQNITALIPKGVDEGNITVLKNIAETIKSKLEQANASLERKDYFTANSLLSDAESLLNELKAKIAEAKAPSAKIDILMLTLIAFAVIIILFVLYLLWPQKQTAKTLPFAK